MRAGGDLVQGRLDEAAAAHLAVAETYAETAPLDRQRRLRVAIASLKLSLARRRGHLAGVIEQVRFLVSPVTGQPGEDIALGTVSTHLRSIYAKLQVRHRSSAVQRARELRLLAAGPTR